VNGWYGRTVLRRTDDDGTQWIIRPVKGCRSVTLTVLHPLGLRARTEHKNVAAAKAHVEELLTSICPAGAARKPEAWRA
jgi:hypothetical protein